MEKVSSGAKGFPFAGSEDFQLAVNYLHGDATFIQSSGETSFGGNGEGDGHQGAGEQGNSHNQLDHQAG